MSQTSDSPAVASDPSGGAVPQLGASPLPQATTPPSLRFAVLVLQLGLLVGIFKLFDIENAALYDRVGPLVLAGFVVHHLLPLRMRMGFFALLSVLSVFAVFAWPAAGRGFQGFSAEGLKGSAWLVALGGILIAACHIPARHSVRCGAVILVGAVFALLRGEWIHLVGALAIPSGIWPILGSMFMFRLAVYLYDLKHGAVPASAAHAVAYFFMVPNVLFTLFPIVDYKTFCRSHYNDDPHRIYQVGLLWIFRGVVHLLLYRQIYNNYMVDPAGVTTALQAGQYIVTTFLLYLKMSGTFHLIVGVLHLFGFNLPETHHLYFLSHSFAEVWRRMNIYWKEFMQKMVFYPLHFRLRWLGKWAIPACTLLTILATWLLHSYQWFWIRKHFPLTWQDFAFWMALAGLVVMNNQWDQRKGRKRTIGKPQRTIRSEVIYGFCAAGTFASMSLLWTLWSTPNVQELKTLGRAMASMRPGEAAIFLAVAVLIGTAAVLTRGKAPEHTDGMRSVDKRGPFPFWRYAAECLAIGGFLAFAGFMPSCLGWFPRLQETIAGLKHPRLNRQDAARLERGYYEDLGDVTRFNDQLWQALAGQDGWADNPALRKRDDVLENDLFPSMNVEFKNVPFITNSLGMRDRPYEAKKAPGTFRILLLGGSHDVGVGVRGEATYENLCEDRLNRERVGSAISRYEILNYSCGAYSPLQKLLTEEMKGLDLDPDLVLYVANRGELRWSAKQFERLVMHDDLELAKYFSPLLRAAGVERGDSRETVLAKFTPHREELLRRLYRRFADDVRAHGARPVFVFLQVPTDTEKTQDVQGVYSILAETGVPVLDLWGAFDSVPDRKSLWITSWDDHTNAKGHALIAERLYQQLITSGLLPDPGAKQEPGK